jgi:hypothetical protein
MAGKFKMAAKTGKKFMPANGQISSNFSNSLLHEICLTSVHIFPLCLNFLIQDGGQNRINGGFVLNGVS